MLPDHYPSGSTAPGLTCIRRESYQATVNSTRKLIRQSPFQTAALVRAVFEPYSLPPYAMPAILQPLLDSPTAMLDFLMRFHHQAAAPDAARPFVCALTISMGYFLGGLVPLIPYFCVHRHQVYLALWWSIGIMAVALFAFGWVKTGVVVGWRGRSNVLAALKGALQMVMIGGTAAGAAVGLVRAINHG